MELIKPDIGLMFWMIVSFAIVLFILRKAAWKPIMGALKSREASIEDSLMSAAKAKEEMEQLKADNEKILEEAKIERGKIIQEGKDIKDKVVNDAKEEASKEAEKIIQNAKKKATEETSKAMGEMKKIVASLSVEVAEKILQEQLKSDQNQQKYINELFNKIDMN